jgi:hypothetical protein
VRAIVGERDVRRTRVALKGITGEQDLVAVQLAPAPKTTERASGG